MNDFSLLKAIGKLLFCIHFTSFVVKARNRSLEWLAEWESIKAHWTEGQVVSRLIRLLTARHLGPVQGLGGGH